MPCLSDHRTSTFLRFLLNRNAVIKEFDGDTRKITHIAQDGWQLGKIRISPSDEKEAYELLAKDFEDGRHLYIIECLTKNFMMFIDWDQKRRIPWSDATIEDAMRLIQKTIAEFFPKRKEKFGLIICRTPDAPVKNGMIKTSLRIFVTGSSASSRLIVDRSRARMLVASIWARLNQFYPVLDDEQNAWQDVCDIGPYGKGGDETGNIRLIGSRKCDVCPGPDCRTKDDQRAECCLRCGGKRKVDVGRVQSPWLALDGNGNKNLLLAEMLKNRSTCLAMTKVRTFEGLTQGWEPPANAPVVKERAEDGSERRQKTIRRLEKIIAETSDDKKRRSAQIRLRLLQDFKDDDEERRTLRLSAGLKSLPINAATKTIVDNMSECIQSLNNHQYHDVTISKIYRNIGKYGITWYRAYVQGFGATYCPNLRGHHNSARIYFEFRKEGVYIRCSCQCQTIVNRVSRRFCSEYRSKTPYPMTKTLNVLLFSESPEKTGSLAVLRQAPKVTAHTTAARRAYARTLQEIIMRLSLDLVSGQGIRLSGKSKYDEEDEGDDGKRKKGKKYSGKKGSSGGKGRASSSNPNNPRSKSSNPRSKPSNPRLRPSNPRSKPTKNPESKPTKNPESKPKKPAVSGKRKRNETDLSDVDEAPDDDIPQYRFYNEDEEDEEKASSKLGVVTDDDE